MKRLVSENNVICCKQNGYLYRVVYDYHASAEPCSCHAPSWFTFPVPWLADYLHLSLSPLYKLLNPLTSLSDLVLKGLNSRRFKLRTLQLPDHSCLSSRLTGHSNSLRPLPSSRVPAFPLLVYLIFSPLNLKPPELCVLLVIVPMDFIFWALFTSFAFVFSLLFPLCPPVLAVSNKLNPFRSLSRLKTVTMMIWIALRKHSSS